MSKTSLKNFVRWDAWQKLVKIEDVFDSSELDITKESDIINFLETAVMLMEGATEEDVKLIQSAPIKLETENGSKESASSHGLLPCYSYILA